MSEYIKKEDAEKRLADILYDEPPYIDSDVAIMRYAKEQMKDLPSIDIVRCSECKYQCSNGDGTGGCDRTIINGDEMSCVVANDDDYCSYGERESEDEKDE